MDTKKAVLKGVLTMVVVALAGFLLFNGIGRHPYQPDELEGVFRKEAAARSVSGEGEVISETYGNAYLCHADGRRQTGMCNLWTQQFFDKYKERNFIPACRERSLRKILFMRRGTTP